MTVDCLDFKAMYPTCRVRNLNQEEWGGVGFKVGKPFWILFARPLEHYVQQS